MANNKTKHRKNHKEKLQNRKNKIKEMSKQQMNGQQPPQMPDVRNVPTWDKEADILVKGYEWEILFNTIASLQVLNQAANSVMSRNVVNGNIRMDFQKLVPETLEYREMTPEEKAPYLEDFNKVVEQIRAQSTIPAQEPLVEEAAPADPGQDPLDEPDAQPTNGKVVNLFQNPVSTAEAAEPTNVPEAPEFAVE